MFDPMKKYFLSALFVVLSIPLIYAQNFDFQMHEIGRHGKLMGQTALVDVDNDGDLDWIYGLRGELFWYEFQDTKSWVHHKLGSGAKTDVGGCPIDINQDGWMDFMVGNAWYENTGKPKEEAFICHSGIGTLTCHDNIAVDIDGDSKLDIVAISNDPGQKLLMWYETDTVPNKKWRSTQIGEGIHGGIGPKGYGDLDADGDIDIVRGNAWFENTDGKGASWKEHATLIPKGGNRPDKYGLALKSWVIDMDGDGDLDVIEAEADTQNGRVFWFENIDKAKKWAYHVISKEQTGQDFHSLAVADFDNDGDMDIFSGGGPLSTNEIEMYIWENKNGDGSLWIEQPLFKGKMCHEAVAADVDGDGDIDICTKPWNGDDLHLFLENKLIVTEK
mgnify:CR=1 FL=1